jgi:WD40 repeat protein
VRKLYRYAAFISYASEDKAFARRLHRTLEAYRIPASVGSFQLTDHPRSKNRLFPIFIDREELPSGGLGTGLERALADSHALIVICSPHAARSEWVDKEIRHFQSQGRAADVFAIIVSGEPNVSRTAGFHTECFPSALRGVGATRVDGSASSSVLAGDARKGKDGFRNAWLKVVAGLLNVNLGRLVDRDRRARRTRALALTCISIGAVAALVTGAFALDESRGRLIIREQALRMSDRPIEQARLLLAASRGDSEMVPSAPDIDDLLSHNALGAIRITTMEDLGKWTVSPRGDRVVTWPSKQIGEEGVEGELHDTMDGRVIARLVVYRAEFSPSSGSLVVWRNGSSATLHAASNGALLANLKGEVDEVAFSPQGDRVLTLPGGELRETRTGALIATIPDVYSTKGSAQFAARGHKFAVNHVLGAWGLYDADSGVALRSLGRHDDLLLSPTGERVVTMAGKEPTMQQLDTTDIEKLKYPVGTLRDISGRPLAHLGELFKYQFSPDGQRLVTNQPGLTLWNAVTGMRLAELSDFDSFIFAQDSVTMVAWGYHKGALIDLRSGRQIADLPEMVPDDFESRLNVNLPNHLGDAVFSPDGSLLATTRSARGKLRDAHTGAILASDVPFGNVFTPGNHWLGSDVFYDVREHRTVFELHVVPNIDGSSAMYFSTDGKTGFADDVPVILTLRLEEPLRAPPGAGRHAEICRVNYDAVGQFDTFAGTGDVVKRLAGRPPHPCDWRGMLSTTGWAQAWRYWRVRLGADWDYARDECTREHPGFGCPARGARRSNR